MEGKEKTKKTRLHQRTCMKNWRIHRVSLRSHVARIEMLLTFHYSVCGRQLRLLMKDCRAYSRRHQSSRTPSPLQRHSSCSREALLITTREGERAASGQLLKTLETEIIFRVWSFFVHQPGK
jgi:hypothetical protein